MGGCSNNSTNHVVIDVLTTFVGTSCWSSCSNNGCGKKNFFDSFVLTTFVVTSCWSSCSPRWPTGSGNGSNPRLLGALINFCYDQLLLNKFFDPSTPSMRKGRGRENKKIGKLKIMTEIVATNVVASQPPNSDRL